MRQQPDYHILLLSFYGGGELISNGQRFEVLDNYLTFIPAGTDSELRLIKEEWHCAWLLLKPNEHWQMFGDKILNQFTEQCEMLINLMQAIYLAQQLGQAVAGCEQELLFHLSHLFKKTDAQTARFEQLLVAIDSQIHLPWTVDTMAAKVYLSNAQFHRRFKALYNQSPKQYVLTAKMNRAAHLLRQQNWSINRVAEYLGFEDSSNFCHCFKKCLGTTPSQFKVVK